MLSGVSCRFEAATLLSVSRFGNLESSMAMRFVTVSRIDRPGWQIPLGSLREVSYLVALLPFVANASRNCDSHHGNNAGTGYNSPPQVVITSAEVQKFFDSFQLSIEPAKMGIGSDRLTSRTRKAYLRIQRFWPYLRLGRFRLLNELARNS